ncbi:cupin domain-containing protein [Halostagnicola bangensis]
MGDSTAESESSESSESEPVLCRSDDVDYEAVDAANGPETGVLIGEEHGAPNFAMGRFTLEAGAPKHTNEVEHREDDTRNGDPRVVERSGYQTAIWFGPYNTDTET